MRRVILTVGLLVVVPIAAPPVAQQTELPLAPGQRVRVEAPMLFEGWRVGEIIRTGVDTLFLRRGAFTGAGSDEAVPVTALTRIQLSEGSKSHVGKGAWIGALGGFAVGAVLGATAAVKEYCDGHCYWWLGVLYIGPPGAAIGAVWGAALGAVIRSEAWRDVPHRQPAVTVRRDAVGVALKLPF